MRVRFQAAVVAGAMAAVLSACGGDTAAPPEPTPGMLAVAFQAPAGAAAGAIVLTVAGPGEITNVTATTGAHQVFSRPTASGVKVGVFGTLGSGTVVRFHVPDTREVDEYSATLIEVAGTDNALKSLSTYGVSVSE